MCDEQNQVFGLTINDFNGDDLLDVASVDYQNNEVNWFENLGENLSVPDLISNAVQIFPNPAKDQFMLNGINEVVELVIYDMLGKRIMTISAQPDKPINISSLQSGMYMVKLSEKNLTFRLVKN